MNKLNEHSMQVIDEIVARHAGRLGPIKLMLHDVQNELGYIPFEAMEKIAVASGTSVADVYGVVTFYAQFTTQPKGKHVINVCLGTACYVKGAQGIIDELLSATQSPVNGTSPNGLFSLDATRCVGACGLAPVVIIDGEVFGSANQSTKVMDTIVSIMLKESA